MEGWKTKLGGGVLILTGVLGYSVTLFGYQGLSLEAATGMIGLGLTALGLGHKADKLKAALESLGSLKKVIPILLLAAAVSACTTGQQLPWSAEKPVIQFDYGSFLVTSMDASSAHAVAKYLVTQECRAGVRAKDQCDILAKADEKIQAADQEVRRSIQDPKYPIDWARMQAFLGDVVGASVRIGVKGAAGL